MKTIILPNTYTGLDSVYLRMAAGDTTVIVCYGNSITFGNSHVNGGIDYPTIWQGLLRQHYNNPNIHVINEGHGGWTAEMAAGGFDTLVPQHLPHLVTLEFGINDLYQEKGLANYAQHLTEMVQKLQQLQIPAIILSPTPLYNEQNKALLDFCSSAEAVAREENVAFFHLHAAMVDSIYAQTNKPETLMPDEIHYTDDGYRMIGEAIMGFWLAKP